MRAKKINEKVIVQNQLSGQIKPEITAIEQDSNSYEKEQSDPRIKA